MKGTMEINMNKTTLSLSGLTCSHCVASVTKALNARSDVKSANVTTEYAIIESDASAADLIATITDAGYQAVVSEKD
ncbi:hypothetical protein HBM99_05340 [Providencia heimbachae]|nr:cation transporter [Providencia sp.]NIH21782.1 hypothetical protein [Providencia heimbachae]